MQGVETEKFWTTSIAVEAIQLTEENVQAVSEMIYGVLDRTGLYPGTCFWFKGEITNIGEWVVKYQDGRYSVFTDGEFKKVFHSHDERMKADEKYAKVYLLVKGAMNKQDTATYYDRSNSAEMDLLAIETTKSILREI